MTDISDRNFFFPNCLYHSFKEPFVVEKANDVYYYSPNDNVPYLDMYNNVTHIGHSNLKVLDAIVKGYSTINIHTRYYQENLINYANHLFQYLPKDTYKILFTNSGSESNDLALQIAMNAMSIDGIDSTLINNNKIGSFKGSYHGTTYLCNKVSHLTPTGSSKEENNNIIFFSPSSKSILDDLDKFDNLDIFITESIQGVAGNIDISDELLQKIREKTKIIA
jgi:4-aminobutyrate aminotransferase-like enzyme